MFGDCMRSSSVKPWNPFASTPARLTVLPTLLSTVGISLILGLACLAPAASAASAQPEPPSGTLTVVLDPDASSVTFTLGATLHTVEGSFRIEEGEITFDPATGEASGQVVVDATSGDTENDKRDRDMHAKVLESETYPEFVLIPTRIEGDFQASGSSEVTLHGSLRIHGGEHEIALPATVAVNPAEGSGADDGAGGELRLEATGTFEVPYVEWGLEDPSKFLLRVSKSVEVTVRAVGRLQEEASEASSPE